MKKQKVIGRSKSKDSCLVAEAVQAIETELTSAETMESPPLPIEQDNRSTPEEEAIQSVPQMSRIQRYWIGTMLVFADCSVQKSPDGIFDVLARNFEDTGNLSWWLWRIGHGEMTQHLKGKDILDASRKIAHELYKHLKTEVGRPSARF